MAFDGWVDEHVFDEDRSFGGAEMPKVVRGVSGVLYYVEDFIGPCRADVEASAAVSAYHAFAAAVEATGRPVVTLVAPDKSSVLTAEVPADLELRICRSEYSDRLWDTLNDAGLAGWVDLRALLRTLADVSESAVYHRYDTHWTPRAGVAVAEVIVDATMAGLFREDEVFDLGVDQHLGDLSTMLGESATEDVSRFEVRRPGVERVEGPPTLDPNAAVTHVRHTSSDGNLVAGRTLFLVDSFGVLTAPLFVPYFEEATVANLRLVAASEIADLLAEADRLIVMSVERHFPRRAIGLFGGPEMMQLIAQLPQG